MDEMKVGSMYEIGLKHDEVVTGTVLDMDEDGTIILTVTLHRDQIKTKWEVK